MDGQRIPRENLPGPCPKMPSWYNIPMKMLETRPFRFKNPLLNFYCPLCRSERALTSTYRLDPRHYLQIILLTLVTLPLLFPLMAWRGLLIFFLYWPVYEFARRAVYRHQVPCPYCGFDAIWYKRDVKVAREGVRRFWQNAKQAQSSDT